MEELRTLHREQQDAEDLGKSPRPYIDAIESKSEELDEVNREWCVEYATTKLAEKQAKNWNNDELGLPADQAIAAPISLERVHPLSLIQSTLDASEVIAGGSILIPAGTEELRNNFLFQISHHNRLDELFIGIDPTTRRLAMNKFGQLIAQHAHSISANPPKYISDLIDGSVKLDVSHKLNDKLSAAIKVLSRSAPKAIGL